MACVSLPAYVIGGGTNLSEFTRMVSMNSSASTSVNGAMGPTVPALAKKTSRRPYRCIASSTTACTALSSPASNCRVWMSTTGHEALISCLCASRLESS